MKSLSDITAPMAVKKKLLEADVQDACVKWARARGYWARKFSSIAQRSVPDYLFSHRGNIAEILWITGGAKIKFACEFKAPGKTSTDAQVEEQELMRLAGWFVFECDNLEVFKATVIAYEKECI